MRSVKTVISSLMTFLEAASQIIPLARTAVEQIQQLQEWAASGRARLASKHSSLTERIQRQL